MSGSPEGHEHGDQLPSVSVQHVSKCYEPIRVRRIEHIFATLGGIVPGDGASFEDEEEDLYDAEVEDTERVSRARIALDDVSFDAVGGSCVGLVGAPRAGKSVLMRIIAGLAPPTSGRVVVRGRVAAALDSSFRLFPRTGKVAKGVPLFAGFHGIAPRVARKHLPEIAEFLDWPDMGKQYMSLLTKEQRTALMIALALHVEADIILIDTPLRSVDELSIKMQERMLELKRQGKLLIMTGLNIKSVSWNAERLIQLERGVIVRDAQIVPRNQPMPLRQQMSNEESEPVEAQFVPVPGEL